MSTPLTPDKDHGADISLAATSTHEIRNILEGVTPEVKEEPMDSEYGSHREADAHDFLLDSLNDANARSEEPVKSENAANNIAAEAEDFELEPIVFSRSGRLVKKIYLGPPSRTPLKRKILEPPPPRPVEQCFCLLCYKTTDNNSTINSTPNIVEQDFQVMFVLKKMLNIPKENLADYLKRLGHPRDWITFCKTCAQTLNKAVVIQKEISRLEQNLRSHQMEMIDKIKKTHKKKEEIPAISKEDKLRVTNEARSFVATGKCTLLVSYGRNIVTHNPVIRRSRKKNFRGKSMSRRARRARALKASASRSLLKPFEKMSLPDMDSDNLTDNHENRLNINLDVPLPPLERSYLKTSERKQVIKRTKEESDNHNADVIALNKGRYRCALCPQIKEMNFSSFTSHILFHFRRPYKCTQCNIYHHSTLDRELETCPTNEARKKNQEVHICSSSSLVKATFNPENIWACDYCEEKFNGDLERDLHETTCSHRNCEAGPHKLKNSCHVCERKFRNVAEWRLHMILEHSEVGAFGCYYCDETFPVKTKEGKDLLDFEKLRAHLSSRHSRCQMETRMAQVCDFCGEVFWTNTGLNKHMETVHGVDKSKSLSCGICEYRCGLRCLLRMHLRNIHYSETKNTNAQICDQCGYKSVKDIRMENHKLNEHGIEPKGRRPISCSEENCCFKAVGNLAMRLHRMKEHGAARNYTCQVCGKGFLNSSKLVCHQQIHANKNLKPFQCEICGNSFAVKNYLYIHMRLSHQNRPFASTNKKKPTRKKISSEPKSVIKDSNGQEEKAPEPSS